METWLIVVIILVCVIAAIAVYTAYTYYNKYKDHITQAKYTVPSDDDDTNANGEPNDDPTSEIIKQFIDGGGKKGSTHIIYNIDNDASDRGVKEFLLINNKNNKKKKKTALTFLATTLYKKNYKLATILDNINNGINNDMFKDTAYSSDEYTSNNMGKRSPDFLAFAECLAVYNKITADKLPQVNSDQKNDAAKMLTPSAPSGKAPLPEHRRPEKKQVLTPEEYISKKEELWCNIAIRVGDTDNDLIMKWVGLDREKELKRNTNIINKAVFECTDDNEPLSTTVSDIKDYTAFMDNYEKSGVTDDEPSINDIMNIYHKGNSIGTDESKNYSVIQFLPNLSKYITDTEDLDIKKICDGMYNLYTNITKWNTFIESSDATEKFYIIMPQKVTLFYVRISDDEKEPLSILISPNSFINSNSVITKENMEYLIKQITILNNPCAASHRKKLEYINKTRDDAKSDIDNVLKKCLDEQKNLPGCDDILVKMNPAWKTIKPPPIPIGTTFFRRQNRPMAANNTQPPNSTHKAQPPGSLNSALTGRRPLANIQHKRRVVFQPNIINILPKDGPDNESVDIVLKDF
jgi:ASC-1-like (ASCH) protein